ncbi:hypothetical protein HIM_07919 [Hirsutella minnesotensis 3608]|uniref:Uncharacterized protein n=1 Tax=Hirsutella minnesotensis 3608 TaxID=1043627 RepID=A0A0F7ZYM4_9HYPO|nr:hypothetical protein HIM_07919 [Hirsutella minnesotensis 3608]
MICTLFAGYDDDEYAIRVAACIARDGDLELEVFWLSDDEEADAETINRVKSLIRDTIIDRVGIKISRNMK